MTTKLQKQLDTTPKLALKASRNAQEEPTAFDQWWASYEPVGSNERNAAAAWLAAVNYVYSIL